VIAHPDHRAFFVSLFHHHAWSTTVLMRALNEGRRKGMIPPSRFLWLKPADRSLWYALHQMAPPLPNEKLRAKRVLAEAAAAHSHYKAEVITNVRCETPILAAAVDGLWEAVAARAEDGS
jgi:intracellular multiplication protein IcmP